MTSRVFEYVDHADDTMDDDADQLYKKRDLIEKLGS